MTKDQVSFLPIDPNDDSEDVQWVRELIELEARYGSNVGRLPNDEARHNLMSNVAIILREAQWDFSEWFPLDHQQIDVSCEGGPPGFPGIYDIGLADQIPRLNGESEIFYIGRGAGQSERDRGTIAVSLHRHIDNGCGPEKWLRLHGPTRQLLARFARAESIGQAIYWEKLRIRWFIEQHWELPVGNKQGVGDHPMDARELLKQMRKWYASAYKSSS